MKKHFNKEPVMTKDNEHFKNPTKRWICDNDYVDNDVNVISLENIEALHTEIVISILNEITKFLSYFAI